MFHKLMIAALVAAPMVILPAHVDAQQRGSDRAQEARQANETAPEGLRTTWEGRTPPAALLDRYPDLAPEPEAAPPEPEPAPPPPADECDPTFVLNPDGTITQVACSGME